MDIGAAIEFYWKHKDDFTKLSALLPKGPGDPTLASDIVVLIGKHWPQANPNNLLEDTLALIKTETAPSVSVPDIPGDIAPGG
jgi:hypothetical protein